MKTLLAVVLLAFLQLANAAELRHYSVGTRAANTDVDYEFTLDQVEVNTLASDTAKTTLIAFCTATLGPLGPLAAEYVNQRVADVKSKAGPKGAWVKMTIRNGSQLKVWDVYPLADPPPNPAPTRNYGKGGGRLYPEKDPNCQRPDCRVR